MRFSSLFRILLPAVAALGVLCVGSSWISDQPKVGAQTKSMMCPEHRQRAEVAGRLLRHDFRRQHRPRPAPGGGVRTEWFTSTPGPGDYYPPGDKSPAGGFLVALQDKSG